MRVKRPFIAERQQTIIEVVLLALKVLVPQNAIFLRQSLLNHVFHNVFKLRFATGFNFDVGK